MDPSSNSPHIRTPKEIRAQIALCTKVFLDFDGVVSDALTYHVDVANRALGKLSLPQIAHVETVRTLKDLNWKSYALHLGLSENDANQFASKSFEILNKEKHIPDFFPGMDEFIKDLHRINKPVVIVSGNTTASIIASLDHYKIGQYVSQIHGKPNSPTKSEVINTTLSKLGISTHQAVIIGDGQSDVIAGKTSGIHTIATTWGYHSRELLEETEPDIIVNNAKELWEIFSASL